MTTTFVEMVNGVTLSATTTAYYTAPGGTSASIQAVTVKNPTNGAVTVNLYRQPSGVNFSAAQNIGSRVIPAGQVMTIYDAINHKLAPGSTLWADGAGCYLNVSGVEYISNT